MAELEFNVMIFNTRGTGTSEGWATEEGLQLDSETVLQYAKKELQTPEENIVLYGHSLGGGIATKLAAKHSLHALAGVVDSCYRGEVKVVLMNFGKEEFRVDKGMRVAQMLVQPVVHAQLIETNNLDETLRNTGGFGSTGY